MGSGIAKCEEGRGNRGAPGPKLAWGATVTPSPPFPRPPCCHRSSLRQGEDQAGAEGEGAGPAEGPPAHQPWLPRQARGERRRQRGGAGGGEVLPPTPSFCPPKPLHFLLLPPKPLVCPPAPHLPPTPKPLILPPSSFLQPPQPLPFLLLPPSPLFSPDLFSLLPGSLRQRHRRRLNRHSTAPGSRRRPPPPCTPPRYPLLLSSNG